MEIEYKEKKERSQFLENMGMGIKKRMKLYKKEYRLYYWIPTLCSFILTLLFMMATFSARMYSQAQIRLCMIDELKICVVFIVFQGVFVMLLSKIFSRRVG